MTRWSYPFKSKGFRQSGSSLEDTRSKLYAPHRLDHRLFLLEHVLLPGLRAQSDPDFTHLILIGDQMPEPWLSRILALVRQVPQIVPVVRPEGAKHLELCRQVIAEHTDHNRDAIAQHRLDDDDGISTKFVARVRSRYEDLWHMQDSKGNLAIDFCRGFLLRSTSKKISMEPKSMRFWAPGMAIIRRPDSKNSLLDYNHLKVWHSMPTFVWPQEAMFIRGAHHDNDSHLATFGRRTRGFKFSHKRPNKYFKKQFGMDFPEIEKIWESQKEHFIGDAGPATD